jgi:tetratricopeptide (TPR) repeat protein
VSAAGNRPDPVEVEIENALDPGRFIADRGCFRFVDGLEQVAAVIGGLVGDEPARAATLYETFLAGCYEKAEEVDDSSGSFGMFAQFLISGWITARQASGACPQQTTTRLLAWMDNDEYGFCHRLEREIATVLDEAGLAAFIDQIRGRFEAADQPTTATDRSDPASQDARRRRAEALRWAEALRSLYASWEDLDEYVQLAERTGLTPDDCLAVANLLTGRGDPAKALSWVERGLKLDAQRPYPSFAAHSLTELKPRLLADLGHGEQALETAWADYRKHPDQYSYDQLMAFVPQTERPTWHGKAITAAMDGDRYLPAVIELLLHTDETDQLGHLAARTSDSGLESIGHHTAEQAGTVLEPGHPGEAARIWRAQGMRILKAGKSKYYDAALRYFEHAKRCYQQAGQSAQWQRVAEEVYAQHSRKTRFLPRFDDLVTGTDATPQPSFLDRAKTRWTPSATDTDTCPTGAHSPTDRTP